MTRARAARFAAAAWIVVLAVAAGACQKAPTETASAGIAWNHSYDAALADAKKSDRPILLDFYTDWCQWCKRLDDSTFVDSAFVGYSRKFTMARLNAEVDTVTAAKYRVKSYPTIVVLRADGTEIDRVLGYYRPAEFMAEVENYLAGRNTLAAMEAEVATKGNDPAFVYALGDKYYGHGLFEEARSEYLKLADLDPANQTGNVDDALYTLARMHRKQADYANDRKYAQMIIDKYPGSDMFLPAHLEIAGAWRRQGEWSTARRLYLDYAKRFPDDEDAPFAREQADTLAAKIAAAGKGA